MIDISKFNDEQREVLSDAICYLADNRIFALIANIEYTPKQMKELLMCALNGSPAYLLEPWERPDGLLEREQEIDYLRVRKLAESFSRSGKPQDKPSVAVKLYAFSQETDNIADSGIEDSMIR